jgi:hypothetical protein
LTFNKLKNYIKENLFAKKTQHSFPTKGKMRFFVLLPCVLLALVRADDEAAAQTHLNELVPNRVLDKLGDGWKRSLAVLQVGFFESLPGFFTFIILLI